MTAIKIKYFTKFSSWLIALFCALKASVVLAAIKIEDTGLNKTAEKSGLKEAGSDGTDLQTLIGQIISSVLLLVGTVFFALMLYGGFTWMKARGNEKEVEKAKDTIVQAIIGIVIIALAYAITRFLIISLAIPGGQ